LNSSSSEDLLILGCGTDSGLTAPFSLIKLCIHHIPIRFEGAVSFERAPGEDPWMNAQGIH
jgi:hypothetical protein